MRRRLSALGCLLTVSACSSSTDGGPGVAQEAPPEGTLLTLAEDADLGFAELGGGAGLQLAGVDSAGRPVLLGTAGGGPPGLARGTDLVGAPALTSLGEYGSVAALAVAPDDTAVLLALAAPGSDVPVAAVLRVTPDGTEQALPITGTAADAPTTLSAYASGFSPDATRAAVAVSPRDTSQGFPEETGTLRLVTVDTTTGAQVAATEVPLADAAAVVPGAPEAVRVDDVAVQADGGVLVAMTVSGQSGSRLLRFDATLAPVGEPVELPALEEFGGFLAVGPDGTAYVTSTGTAVVLNRVPVGATAAEEVATVEDGPGGVTGLAVDPTGNWAYLTGVTDVDRGETVTGVELATGEVTADVELCTEGSLGEPSMNAAGPAMVVPGRCNDPSTNQAHAYLLTS